MSEQPQWPTREQVKAAMTRPNASTSARCDEIFALFEPFRMLEIRGILGSYYVGVEEFLLASREAENYRQLKADREA